MQKPARPRVLIAGGGVAGLKTLLVLRTLASDRVDVTILCGRYLAPYLSSQIGEAADVMPQGEHAIPVETTLDPITPTAEPTYGELCDRPVKDRPPQGANHEQL